MRTRDIIGNIRDRFNSEENIGGEIDNAEDSVESRLIVGQYLQWYEEDAERLRLEQEKMQEEFPAFKCCKFNDARICFMGKMSNHEVAFVCGYNYPREPAEALLISGDAVSSKLVSADGLVDVFGSGDMAWDANATLVVDVAKKVRTMLEIFLSLGNKNRGEKD